ncbi:MAG: hypothetical protein ACP5G1_01685 [Nanopusillaceae archaeon]
MEIIGIGIKLDIEKGKIKIEKNKNKMTIDYGKTITSNDYNDNKINWNGEIEIKDNSITLINSDRDLYIYEYNQISNKDRIYSINQVIFIGYNLRETKKFTLKENHLYLLTPSKKIIIGKGKIETDFASKLINEDKIGRDILLASDGLIIFNNTLQ